MSARFHELEQKPQPSWGETTDPAYHDPAQFRYLVHAINPFSSLNAMIVTGHDARNGVTYDASWGDQSISMYEQPERIAERVSLSMSLIDQEHTATWGEAGLLIEAPEKNVILTATSDAGSHNNNLNFLLAQAKKSIVTSGDSLLQRSSPCSYNEVVAVASLDGKQLQIKGFFYKTTSTGEPINRQLANRMITHANRLGLPVVTLANLSPYAEDKLQRSTSYEGDTTNIALHFNGSRYLLDGFNEKQRFKVYDETGRSHFAAPHEFEAALGYAVASEGMVREEAAKIAQSYFEADERRQTPTAVYDAEGDFKQIVFHQGYGPTEVKMHLYKSGHGYRTNVVLLAAKNEEAMLNSSMNKMMMLDFSQDRTQSPLSPYEAKKMVDQACEQLNEVQATSVREWYAGKREVGEKQWDFHMQRSSSLGQIGLM